METDNKCCGGCKWFTNECATGEGICEAPLPFWIWGEQSSVTFCSDGSDCSAWRGRDTKIDEIGISSTMNNYGEIEVYLEQGDDIIDIRSYQLEQVITELQKIHDSQKGETNDN